MGSHVRTSTTLASRQHPSALSYSSCGKVDSSDSNGLPEPEMTERKPVSRWGKGRGGRPWRRLVEAVKRRDQYTCQACGRVTEDGECDHIVTLSQGGTDDLSNLQWLCREPCHRAKTAREGSGASNHPEWLPKPACRVELVTGPPGAGKTTYCLAN